MDGLRNSKDAWFGVLGLTAMVLPFNDESEFHIFCSRELLQGAELIISPQMN